MGGGHVGVIGGGQVGVWGNGGVRGKQSFVEESAVLEIEKTVSIENKG